MPKHKYFIFHDFCDLFDPALAGKQESQAGNILALIWVLPVTISSLWTNKLFCFQALLDGIIVYPSRGEQYGLLQRFLSLISSPAKKLNLTRWAKNGQIISFKF